MNNSKKMKQSMSKITAMHYRIYCLCLLFSTLLVVPTSAQESEDPESAPQQPSQPCSCACCSLDVYPMEIAQIQLSKPAFKLLSSFTYNTTHSLSYTFLFHLQGTNVYLRPPPHEPLCTLYCVSNT